MTAPLAGIALRRELELAGDALPQRGHELRAQMRAAHIGDDWMLDDEPDDRERKA